MADTRESVASRITNLRTGARMTQEELGARIGKSKSAICNYEKGFNVPPLDVLIELAQIFDTTLDFLVGSSDLQTRFDQFSVSQRIEVYSADRAEDIFEDELIKNRKYIDLPQDSSITNQDEYVALQMNDNLFESMGLRRLDYMIVKREENLVPRKTGVIAVKNHILAGRVSEANGFFSVSVSDNPSAVPMRFHAKRDNVRVVGTVVKKITNVG